MKKRFLSILLVLCMVLTLVPATVFAADTTVGENEAYVEEPEHTAIEKVQALIDALPDADTITEENRADVEAQLTAIDDAKEPLGDEERAALDFGKYDAAVAAINALDGMPGAEVPTVMDLQSELSGGGTVKLSADYTITAQITITNTVTLDLNGNVIKQEGNYRIFNILGGHLTLTDTNPNATHEDTSLPAGGVLTGGKTSFNGGGISISNNGSFTMNGGTITNCEASTGSKGGGVYLDSTSSFTMNDGTITSCKAGNSGGGVFAGGSFTMNGGTIRNCSAVTHNDSSGVYVDSSGTFTMTGGTISSNVDNSSGGEMYADGGVISGAFSGKVNRHDDAIGYTTFSGRVNSSDSDISENAKLTVTFNPNNLTAAFEQKVLKGQKVTKPSDPDPTREGWAFTGWYEMKTDGQFDENLYKFDTPVMDQTDLYAFWKQAYQVTYNPGTDGTGNIVTDTKIENEPLALSSETFTRTGFTQTGWAATDGGKKMFDLGGKYTTDADITLYPVWKANQYTITVKPTNGNKDITIKQDYGTTVTVPTLTRDGYVFDGWDKTFPTTMPAENMTITANWDEIITVSVPFTTEVKLGDTGKPGDTEFDLAIVYAGVSEEDYAHVTVSGTLTTNGAGNYDGMLTLTGPSLELQDMLRDGAIVQQVNGGEANWTYDDTVWGLLLYNGAMYAGLNDEQEQTPAMQVDIYHATCEETENCSRYELDWEAVYAYQPVDKMTFTNTYTAHEYALNHDTDGHWDECPCGDVQNQEAHKFGEWTETKAPTHAAKGEKERVCSVCDYTETAEIPMLEKNEPPKTDVPQTGDNSHMALWLALILVSGGALIGITVYGKKRKRSAK